MKKQTSMHPGAILKYLYLIPQNISVAGLAKSLNVSRSNLYYLISGKSSITSELALKFSNYFRTPPEFWINLQLNYVFQNHNDVYSGTIYRSDTRSNCIY